MFRSALRNWLLPKVVSRACDSRIPRSGERGAAVNCFVVTIDHDGEPFFVATGSDERSLTGLKWDGESYAQEYKMPIEDIPESELRVSHYWGLNTIIYTGTIDLALHRLTGAVYIKLWLYRWLNSIDQYFFNKRKFVTKKRMELLKLMMDDQIDREHEGIGTIELMSKLHSKKWVLHPHAEQQQRVLELYLESLQNAGEVKKINHDYVVTGKAITTIERYEEEERRHTEAVKLQRKLVALTLLLVLVAALQSDLVKLPTVWDWGEKKPADVQHNNAMQPTRETRG